MAQEGCGDVEAASWVVLGAIHQEGTGGAPGWRRREVTQGCRGHRRALRSRTRSRTSLDAAGGPLGVPYNSGLHPLERRPSAGAARPITPSFVRPAPLQDETGTNTTAG